jgi:hypothetical protein
MRPLKNMFWSNSMKKNTEKVKKALFVFSLILNGLFVSLFVIASFSKSSSLYFHPPEDGYATTAAVVSFSSEKEPVFELITISLKPFEKAFLQFSFVSSNKQSNLLINCLYDPDVVSISRTGYGIEITALSEGGTLMQAVTNDGIKNIAFIEVSE